jgi:hypothetical protein
MSSSLVSTRNSGDIAYRSSFLLSLLLHKSTSLAQGLGKTRCRDSAHPPPLAGVNLSTVFSGLEQEEKKGETEEIVQYTVKSQN